MNGKEFKMIESQLGDMQKTLKNVHDDVLVLKTQRDFATKAAAFIAAGVSLIVTSLMLWLNGR